MNPLQERVEERIREWNVVVQTTRETQSSYIVFGMRGDKGVVLKVIREMGDAIDPKGVVGELEYEVGAALRNPSEKPELFASAVTIEARIARFKAELKLNSERALAWGFAQAVLSAIWTVEDGFVIDSENPGIRLAHAIRPMLTQSNFTEAKR